MIETAIEWTDSTWNPVAGCSAMSAGCTNCYAMQMARRLEAMGIKKYKGLTRKSGSRTVWKGIVHEDHASLDIPIRWKKPRRIFVNSMSDLFHPSVSPEFSAKIWSVMEKTQQHSYQILTKRPDRLAVLSASGFLARLPNVWLGTSVEDESVAHRIAELQNVPAAIRFISFEPLIGSVGRVDLTGIDWAIVGGESGPRARPIQEAWIDEIYDACQFFGTAFFFKQWGAWGKDKRRRSKKRNGRIYRGKTWDEMPATKPIRGLDTMTTKPYKWKSGAKLQGHSKQKHKILRDYFRRYLRERCKNPNSRRFRLAIVDAFAGGGIYEDGSLGSPVIFAKTLLESAAEINQERAVDGMPPVEVDCLMILNDPDPEAYRLFQEAVAPYGAAAQEEGSNVNLIFKFYQCEFEASVDEFCNLIGNERYRNVIYNLDQCGHSHVNRTTITRLIGSANSVEIFLTYAVQSLITFLNRTDPEAVRNQLRYLDLHPDALEFSDNLMSKREWLGTAERIVFDHFCECAPFVTPFSINNPGGWQYWFMHFAKSYRARQVYNDVLHENSNAQAHFGRSGLKMLSYDPSQEGGFLYLFDLDARSSANEQLHDDIPRLVSEGGDAMTIPEFYAAVYNETPAHSDDIHTAIMENLDLEVLTPKGKTRRFARTISQTDTLRLKNQLSFNIPPPKKNQSK